MEECCYEVSGVLVSPDGGLYQKQDAVEYKAFLISESNTSKFPVAELAVEIKCPFPGDYETPVHYKLPHYDVTQILSEMASMGVSSRLFCSWSSNSMTIHLADFDEELWDKLVTETKDLYQC